MDFYRSQRVYVSSKGEFDDFIDALPKELTIQKVAHDNNPLPVGHHNTLFKEVMLKPYVETNTDLIRELNNITPQNNDWINVMWNVLKDIIYKSWSPDKFHVVAHSSGHDSRIISTIIKELRQQHGDNWLGGLLFVENGGEGKEFEMIMQHQGWEKDKYIVFNKDSTPGEYHKYSLNFDTMWEKFNGISGYPYNYWWDSFRILQDADIIPDNIQGFTGYGAYIEQAVKKERLDACFRGMTFRAWFMWDYYYQIIMFRCLGEWVYPWLSHDYMRAMAGSVGARNSSRRISDHLSRHKTGLNHIARMSVPDVERRGYRTVSNDLLKEIYKKYKKSWYGKRVSVMPKSYINYSEWWWHLNAASLCEHLIKKGYDIKDVKK